MDVFVEETPTPYRPRDRINCSLSTAIFRRPRCKETTTLGARRLQQLINITLSFDSNAAIVKFETLCRPYSCLRSSFRKFTMTFRGHNTRS